MVDNNAWKEVEEYYLRTKEQELANEIIALLKARNELDVAIYKKRQEYAKICEMMDNLGMDEKTK